MARERVDKGEVYSSLPNTRDSWLDSSNPMGQNMAKQIDVEQNIDHIGGNFEWEIEPTCSCGKIKEAVEEQFIFVSNFVSGDYNSFYFLPVSSDGFLFRSNGIPISYCPWCGDEIKGRKKYPTPKQ
jgi:hypothetical protein